jgi:hypothetical protein
MLKFTSNETASGSPPVASIGGVIMEITRIDNYIESETELERGHVNTREWNFECENKDPHLGCDLGVDVPG